jgi:hypothetical protein
LAEQQLVQYSAGNGMCWRLVDVGASSSSIPRQWRQKNA